MGFGAKFQPDNAPQPELVPSGAGVEGAGQGGGVLLGGLGASVDFQRVQAQVVPAKQSEINTKSLCHFYLRQSQQVIERCELFLLLLGDYFEVMTLKMDLKSRSTRSLDPGLLYSFISHPKKFSGWDPSKLFRICYSLTINQISLRVGGIRSDRHSLTRFLFGVG